MFSKKLIDRRSGKDRRRGPRRRGNLITVNVEIDVDQTYDEIIEAIKKRMQTLGISVDDLAEIWGRNPSAVRRTLKRDSPKETPRNMTVQRFLITCNALKTHPCALLLRDDDRLFWNTYFSLSPEERADLQRFIWRFRQPG